MVLIGLIIIAVALMAPGCRVSGGSCRRQCQPQARPGSARIPRRDIVSTFTSRDARATGQPRPGTGNPRRSPGTTVRLTHPNLAHAANASSRYGHAGGSSTTRPATPRRRSRQIAGRAYAQIDRICTHNERTRHDSAAAPNGGYAPAGSTSGGSGMSRARRVTGGVTADSGVARWRADGLWTMRGRHRFDLPWRGWPPGLPYGGSTRFYGVQLDGKVIGAGLRAVRDLAAVAEAVAVLA